MKYKVLLVEDSERGVGVAVLCATSDSKVIDGIREAIPRILSQHSALGHHSVNLEVVPKAGPKGKPVSVVSVAEDSPYAAIFKPGDRFDNAQVLSRAMAFGYNAVNIQLNNAKGKGETSVLVKGVEISYVEDLGGRI